MKREVIKEIGIDDDGRLYVLPSSSRFPFIYREAMEIHWDENKGVLFAPPPPRFLLAEPIWWLMRILDAAKQQECQLIIDSSTRWQNISPELRENAILQEKMRDIS